MKQALPSRSQSRGDRKTQHGATGAQWCGYCDVITVNLTTVNLGCKISETTNVWQLFILLYE